MRLATLQNASIAEYFQVIESQPQGLTHLFRGQRDSSWGLIPSLYRLRNLCCQTGKLEEDYDTHEDQSIALFFREGLPYLPQIARNSTNDRVIAQHFGVPTRLLDWSRDPLVALYFAVEEVSAGVDAAVFMIAPNIEGPREIRSVAGERPVIAITPPAIDRRIPAQKSVFTFHPYGESNEPFVPLDKRDDIGREFHTGSTTKRGFAKIVIPAALTERLRNKLFKMGIDRRNLFPGLDGVGRDVGARSALGLF